MNHIGTHNSISSISLLRQKAAAAIAEAKSLPKDPTEVTAPEGQGNMEQLANPKPGMEKLKNTENNQSLGTEVNPPADGNAQETVGTESAKLAKKATQLMDAVARSRKQNKQAMNAQDQVDSTVLALVASMDASALQKLAGVVLSSEKLATDVQVEMEKYMSKQAAVNMINATIIEHNDMQKQASFSESDYFNMVHQFAMEKSAAAMENPEMYAAGVEDAAAAQGDESIPTPEEVVEAVGEMIDAGEISEEQGVAVLESILGEEGEVAEDEEADEAPVSEDEVLAELAAMEGAGEISEKQASEVMEVLAIGYSDAAISNTLAEMVGNGEITVKEAAAVEEALEEGVDYDGGEVDETDEEVTVAEVEDELLAMVEAGEITEDEADAIIEEIDPETSEGEEAEVSEDDVVEAIAEMLDAGEIDEDQAEAVIQELAAQA